MAATAADHAHSAAAGDTANRELMTELNRR
jgi:hypothetical protein